MDASKAKKEASRLMIKAKWFRKQIHNCSRATALIHILQPVSMVFSRGVRRWIGRRGGFSAPRGPGKALLKR